MLHSTRVLIPLLTICLLLVACGSSNSGDNSYQPQTKNVGSNSNVAGTYASPSATTTIPSPSSTISKANPDPYSPSGTLALIDPLSNNNRGYGWDVNSSSEQSCQFTNGAYYAYAQANIYLNCRPSIKPSNFTFEVRMQVVSGNCGGLTLRDGGDLNAYSYQVCQDGSYQLNLWGGNGGGKTLASASSKAITAGLGQSNLIAIVANGSSFDLYVNHQKLTSVNDSTYTTGMFGLTASNSKVAYTNARLWT